MVLLPIGGLETIRCRQVSHLSSQKVLCYGLGTEIIFLGSLFLPILSTLEIKAVGIGISVKARRFNTRLVFRQ